MLFTCASPCAECALHRPSRARPEALKTLYSCGFLALFGPFCKSCYFARFARLKRAKSLYRGRRRRGFGRFGGRQQALLREDSAVVIRLHNRGVGEAFALSDAFLHR